MASLAFATFKRNPALPPTMKSVFKGILSTLSLLWVSPLLVLFGLSADRDTIRYDTKCWIENLDRPNRSPLVNLLYLLAKHPEFRNLFYHRIFQSNLLSRIVLALLKIVYRPCPYLFIDNSSKIGSGLFLQHGFSTIIMADMGENCWVNQQVTIGYKDRSGRPSIGNNVRITAGAKVLGNIKVGDNVVVGANAVVVKNVPANCVVVGVPAYIVKRDGVKVNEPLV
ncbi:Serine acetyltransferase [Geitlerinema sp. FC II]|nr:Serine acetyltransferase [Geitlerinema sp. FC II]